MQLHIHFAMPGDRRYYRFTALILLLIGIMGARAFAAPLATRETSLGISPPAVVSKCTVSPDGKHIAWIDDKDVRQCVVIDGESGPLYDRIESQHTISVVFSPDGTQNAYIAWRNDSCFVVLNGVEGANYEVISPSDLTFSPDSRHFAYVGYSEGQAYVVRDGIKGKAYRRIAGLDLFGMLPSVRFSNDSRHMLYVAGDAAGNQFVVVDDRCEGPHSEAICPAFSPDSAHVAYASKVGKSWRVIHDGKPGRSYQGLFGGKSTIVFSADGQHYAYSAKENGKWTVVVDGKQQGFFDSMVGSTIGFLKSGKCVCYGKRGEQDVLINGDSTLKFEYIYAIQISGDGAHLAIRTHCGGRKQTIVYDGKPGRKYDDRGDYEMCFSPNSRRLAYIARSGEKVFVVVDGVQEKQFDNITSLVFSNNSAHLAYIGQNYKGVYVVHDGVVSRRYDDILGDVKFSPDGKHLAYVAKQNGFCHVIIDGVESPVYDMVLRDGALAFDAENLHAFAVRGNKVLKIQIPLTKYKD